MTTTPLLSFDLDRTYSAPPERVWSAFTRAELLQRWICPDPDWNVSACEVDPRTGGGYRMSLFYPASEPEATGKTTAREDRFTARYVELTPPDRIVEAITFDSTAPAFAGEMTMVVTLEEREGGAVVTIAFEKLPPGIRPEDNEAGTQLALEKLARYVDQPADRRSRPFGIVR